jgi:hypothetical protein
VAVLGMVVADLFDDEERGEGVGVTLRATAQPRNQMLDHRENQTLGRFRRTWRPQSLANRD